MKSLARNANLYVIIILAMFALGDSCDRLPTTAWDPLRGLVIDSNSAPIVGAKVVAAKFSGMRAYETSGDSAFTDQYGHYYLARGFPTEYYTSISCAVEDKVGDWISFYAIFFHPDYDTTVAVFAREQPLDVFLQQTAGFIDTLIIGPNTYGAFRAVHVVPAIRMKPKP